MPDEIRFDDQVVLVTGAGRGLGRAYAVDIARRGATIVVHDAGVGRDGAGIDPAVADAVANIHVNCISPVAATRVFTRQVDAGEFTPEQVAPGVVYLASPECTRSGLVLTSADGRFSVRSSHRSQGVEFGRKPATAEDIRDRWDEILNE